MNRTGRLLVSLVLLVHTTAQAFQPGEDLVQRCIDASGIKAGDVPAGIRSRGIELGARSVRIVIEVPGGKRPISCRIHGAGPIEPAEHEVSVAKTFIDTSSLESSGSLETVVIDDQ